MAVLALVVLVLLALGLQAADRPRLRAAERAYVEGRQVTACSTRELAPWATKDQDDLEGFDEALEDIVVAARADAVRVRDRARRLSSGILPATRAATEAVREAIDAEVALYDDLVDDPSASEGALKTLAGANGTAERRLARARTWVAARATSGWDDRNRCQASASPSSSK